MHGFIAKFGIIIDIFKEFLEKFWKYASKKCDSQVLQFR